MKKRYCIVVVTFFSMSFSCCFDQWLSTRRQVFERSLFFHPEYVYHSQQILKIIGKRIGIVSCDIAERLDPFIILLSEILMYGAYQFQKTMSVPFEAEYRVLDELRRINMVWKTHVNHHVASSSDELVI
ncbi:MAG: hypothetical protein WBQ73_04025 [Candidatus Babeliales bacterium]